MTLTVFKFNFFSEVIVLKSLLGTLACSTASWTNTSPTQNLFLKNENFTTDRSTRTLVSHQPRLRYLFNAYTVTIWLTDI